MNLLFHKEDSLVRTKSMGETGNMKENGGTDPEIQWKESPRLQLYSRPKRQRVYIRTGIKKFPERLLKKVSTHFEKQTQ